MKVDAQVAEVIVPVGHNARINNICYSPDHKLMATAAGELTADKTVTGNLVKVWDAYNANELFTLNGFLQPVTTLCFSHNGQYLAGATESGQVIIWELNGEAEFQRLECGNHVKSLSFTGDDASITVVTDKITIWDISSGKQIQTTGLENNNFNDLAFDGTGNLLAIAETRRDISIYRAGVFQKKIEAFTGSCRRLVFTSDGKLACLGTNVSLNGEVKSVFKSIELRGQQEAFTQNGTLLTTGNQYTISGSGRYLAVAEGNAVVVRESETGRQVQRYSNRYTDNDSMYATAICFGSDETTISIAYGNMPFGRHEIVQYSLKSSLPQLVFIGHAKMPQTAFFCDNGESVVAGYNTGSSSLFWDLKKGKISKQGRMGEEMVSPNGQFTLWQQDNEWMVEQTATHKSFALTGNKPLMFSANGVFLLTVATGSLQNKSPEYSVFDLNAATSIRTIPLEGSVQISPAGNYIAEQIKVANNITWRFYNIKTGKISGTLTQVSGINFSADDGLVAAVVNPDNTSLNIWRTTDLRLMASLRHTERVWDYNFIANGRQLISGSADNTARLWLIERAAVITTFRGHNSTVSKLCLSRDEKWLATGDLAGAIKLWDVATGKELLGLNGHTQRISSLHFSANTKYMLSASDDYTVRLWDIKAGGELAKLYAIDSADFMIGEPDGYYMATTGAAKKLHFKVADQTFSFDQFDLQFNRPDEVLKKIGLASPDLLAMYRHSYDKRLKRMGFDPFTFEKDRSFNVPDLQIADRSAISPVVNVPLLKFSINANDEQYRLDRLNLYVNGVPVYGSTGLSLKQNNTRHLQKEISLRLSTGKNRIEVSVLNEKGVESIKQQIITEYVSSSQKPALYLVTIGVSNYVNPKMNLTYAAKDAIDFSTAFNEKINGFSKIIPLQLTNEKATRSAIMQIKASLINTHEDDYVVLFYAGHGILDDSLDYYLSTYDMDFSYPAKKGLLYNDLESLLDGIPARNKILLLDACHSGEVDKEDAKKITSASIEQGVVSFRSAGGNNVAAKDQAAMQSAELMKQLFVDLRRASGATVISSAGANEYALEGDSWKNGVFTYSLLSGLKESKADLNHDGKIMLSELQQYVQQRVSFLTAGKQTPVLRTENLANDIQIW